MSSSTPFLQTELGLRVISAIVMLVIILSISWWGGTGFIVLCTLISALLFYEWQSIVRQTAFDGVEAVLTLGFAGLLVAGLTGYVMHGIVCFLILGYVLELFSSGAEKSDVRWIGLGALYCAIPAIAFPLIREGGGFAMLLFLFLVVWATDIGGYFVGRLVGGAKLCPAISPKKTWSGALGGMALAVIIALCFAAMNENIGLLFALSGAIILSVISQSGDLFESWVKRLFDRKDSSNLIPGHGGILDRVDGLVAAAVPVAVMVGLNL